MHPHSVCTPLPPPTAGLRRYLYFTAAVAGAAILIVEILGAKILAPWFGTSHFVWTAQIAVTLVALACGYHAGGRWADRAAGLGRPFAAIAAAAVYLCAAVPACETVAYACFDLDLAIGSLLASAFLFFAPLALLATIGPFFVRALTGSVESVGGHVGRLTAVSTLGSVIGTLLIGYVLIPFLPNSVTMVVTAAVLMCTSLGYFVAWGRAGAKAAQLAPAVLFAACCGYAGVRGDRLDVPGIRELHRTHSNFGLLQVVEWEGQDRRSLLDDYLVQNSYDARTHRSLSMYTYLLHGLARAYTSRIDDALCIGLGVGSVPMAFAREDVRVDVVEINPAVVPIATDYFDLQPEMLSIHLGDGRCFVERTLGRYDTIIVDAFLGDSTPSHLLTREAFAAMRRILKPAGTVVLNLLGGLPGADAFLVASVAKTLRCDFARVIVHDGGGGNLFVIASDQARLTRGAPPDPERVHPLVRTAVAQAFNRIASVDLDRGIVLTDDYNPAEFYDARNREALRRRLALKMRGR